MTAPSTVLAPTARPNVQPRRRLGATTPGRLRLLSLLGVASVLVAAVVAGVGAGALSSSTNRARTSSAPALVATQEVFSSLAEADAAATAAFLSGATEDREQRRLYEDALARSSQRLTEVARLVGGSAEGRAAAEDLAAKIATYSGLIESARTYNLLRVQGGEPVLQQAIDLVRDGIAPDVGTLSSVTQRRFNADEGSGRPWLIAAIVLVALATVALVAIQVRVARATRRIFNLPLVGATLLLLGVGIWVSLAVVRQSSDLHNARNHGFASVKLTGQVQTLAYRAKADHTLALVLTAPGGAATSAGAAQSTTGPAPGTACPAPGAGAAPAAGTPAASPPVGSAPAQSAAPGTGGSPAASGSPGANSGGGGRSPAQTEADAAQAVGQLAAGAITDQQIRQARVGQLDRAEEGRGLLFAAARAADNPREQAAAAEMLVRWRRYADQQQQVEEALQQGRTSDAVCLATGPASNTFNGFNLAVESVLSDNTTQFSGDLTAAQDRLAWLRPGLVLIPLLAALLVLWGLQLRINEYR